MNSAISEETQNLIPDKIEVILTQIKRSFHPNLIKGM